MAQRSAVFQSVVRPADTEWWLARVGALAFLSFIPFVISTGMALLDPLRAGCFALGSWAVFVPSAVGLYRLSRRRYPLRVERVEGQQPAFVVDRPSNPIRIEGPYEVAYGFVPFANVKTAPDLVELRFAVLQDGVPVLTLAAKHRLPPPVGWEEGVSFEDASTERSFGAVEDHLMAGMVLALRKGG